MNGVDVYICNQWKWRSIHVHVHTMHPVLPITAGHFLSIMAFHRSITRMCAQDVRQVHGLRWLVHILHFKGGNIIEVKRMMATWLLPFSITYFL